MKATKTLTGLLLLTNGSHIQFTAAGGLAAQHIIKQLASGHVFTSPSLILATERGLIVCHPPDIVRLDVEGDGLDDLLLLDGIGPDVQRTEITSEEWDRHVAESESYGSKRSVLVGTPGKPVSVCIRFAMSGGTFVFVRHTLRARLALEQRAFLRKFNDHAAFPFRNQTGGIGLLNPANAVTATSYPGGEPPADAWSVTDFVVQEKPSLV